MSTPRRPRSKKITMAEAPPVPSANEKAASIPKDLSGEMARLVLSGYYSPIPGQPRYNPDDLVTRKGLEVYEVMGNDDQVQAVTTLKRHAVLSTPLEVVPASASEVDKLIAEFIRWNLASMEGSIETNLFEILSAFQYGFSVTEKVFRVIQDSELPEFDGKVGWTAWRTKSPFPWWFEQDEFGNVLPNGIVQQGSKGLLKLPREKFIVYSHNSSFQNPYGRSDYRAAYRPWFSKDWTIRFMNRIIEKFGSPTPVAKVPAHIGDKDLAAVQGFLKGWAQMTYGTIPEGVMLELIEAKGQQVINFIEVITAHNQSIARAALLPDLLGFSGTGRAGSYAMSQTHFKVFLWVIQSIRRVIEENVLLEQAIKQLVDFNWSGVRRYPTIRFQAVDDQDIQSRAQCVQMMCQIGVMSPKESWVRNYLNFPAITPSDELIIEEDRKKAEEAQAAMQAAEAAKNAPPPPKQEVAPPEKPEAPSKKGFNSVIALFTEHGIQPKSFKCDGCPGTVNPSGFVYDRKERGVRHLECSGHLQDPDRYALVHPEATPKKRVIPYLPAGGPPAVVTFAKKEKLKLGAPGPDGLRRDKTFAERTTNFVAMAKGGEKLARNVVKAAAPIFTSLRHKLLDRLDELSIWKKLLDPNKATDAIAKAKTVKLNMGPLRKLLYNASICSALNGRWLALKDLAQRAQRSKCLKQYIDDEFDIIDEPLDPVDAIKFFGTKTVVVGGRQIRIQIGSEELDFFDRRIFTMAGIESDRMLADTQNALLRGLKSGDPAKAKEDVSSIFDRYIETGEVDENSDIIPANRIEAIVRTNMNEAFNEGRKKLYEDADVREEILGYQWSSIIDTGTTPYCCPAGTEVRCAYRWDKPGARFQAYHRAIEKLKVGDLVLTKSDRYRQVTDVMSRLYTGQMVSIATESGQFLTVTEDHPVWTNNRGWVVAGSLSTDDDVEILKKRVDTLPNPHVWNPDKDVVSEYASGDSTGTISLRYGVSKKKVRAYLRRSGVILRSQAESLRLGFPGKKELFDRLRIENKTRLLGINKGRPRHDQRDRMLRDNPMWKEEVRNKVSKTLTGLCAGAKHHMYGKPARHGFNGMWHQGRRSDLEGAYFRSSWEANFARILNHLGIKLEYESKAFPLKSGTTYRPDFFLPEYEMWVEVKGWFQPKYQQRMDEFCSEYPDHTVCLLDRLRYRAIGKMFKSSIPEWEGR